MLPIYLILDICLFISEILLVLRRRASASTEKKDRGSLRLLWIIITVSMTAGHFVASTGPLLPRISVGVGAVIFLAGIAIRWWAIIHLGQLFTVDVAVANDHRLVETGLYRYVRHPSYTGLLIEFLGIAVCLRSIWSVLVILLPIWLALHRRMTIEEHALREKLGASYVGYCARTRRLLPMIY